MTIHPTAVVEPGAELGKDVTVGPFSYIQDRTFVGDGTRIGPNVTILKHTSLGEHCELHSGSVVGDAPQDLSFEGQDSYVKVGDNCIIREGVTIHRGTAPGSTTSIGDDCFLMGFSHFAHNVQLGNKVIVANGTLCAGYAQVGDAAFLSGHCAIHQFARIGQLAMIGPFCVVTKDVPPFCMTNPMSRNEVRSLNVVGMRRSGMSQDDRQQVKRAFTALYRTGLNVSQALAQIRNDFPSGPAVQLAQFVESSERGICPLTSRPGPDE